MSTNPDGNPMVTTQRINRSLRRKVRICRRLQTRSRVHQPDLGGLARLVQGDAALATDLMRRVNATVRGLSHAVTTVEHAIALLGAAGVAEFADAEMQRLSEGLNHVRADQVQEVIPIPRRAIPSPDSLTRQDLTRPSRAG